MQVHIWNKAYVYVEVEFSPFTDQSSRDVLAYNLVLRSSVVLCVGWGLRLHLTGVNVSREHKRISQGHLNGPGGLGFPNHFTSYLRYDSKGRVYLQTGPFHTLTDVPEIR